MRLPNIKEWKGLFEPWILQRGEDYCFGGAVDDLSFNQEEKVITASVSGTKLYNVEIGLTEDGEYIKYMDCDCPYAESHNNCKHMAAIFYAFEQAKINVAKPNKKQPPLSESIDKLSVNKLKALLLQAAESDRSLRGKIILAANPTAVQNPKKIWKNEISRITRAAKDRDGFISYRNAFDYTDDLCDYMQERVPALIENGDLEGAMQLVFLIYDEAFSVDMDDSDGGLTMLASECIGYWNEILPQCDLKLKRKLYDWFERKDDDDLFAFDYKFSVFTEAEFFKKTVGGNGWIQCELPLFAGGAKSRNR